MLHTVSDGHGKPVRLLLSEGQLSDDRDANGFCLISPIASSLITECIQLSKNRATRRHYSKRLHPQRHKIEGMIGFLKDWHRIAMRDDCCVHTFVSAICFAETVILYLK